MMPPTMPALQLDNHHHSISPYSQQHPQPNRSAAQPYLKMSAARILLLLALVLSAFTLYKCVNVQMIETALMTVKADPYGTLHIFVTFYVISVVFFFPCMVLQVSTAGHNILCATSIPLYVLVSVQSRHPTTSHASICMASNGGNLGQQTARSLLRYSPFDEQAIFHLFLIKKDISLLTCDCCVMTRTLVFTRQPRAPVSR